MSTSEIDENDFKLVSKRLSRRKATKLPEKSEQFEKPELEIDIDRAKLRIISAEEDIRSSVYLEQLLESVSTVCKTRNVVEIVCLGLGHIGECIISRYQLALLLALKEKLKPKNVFAHDPIFYKDECIILNNFDIQLIEDNTEGKINITKEGTTLVYLPHCPKQLTNNFLWCNWGINLQNCILICNSFNSIFENQLSRVISQTVPYIFKIFPFTTEISIDNNFKYTDIFNDTSIHYFPSEKLKALNAEFWDSTTKPDYNDTEEFITSQMIEKLTI